LGVATERCLRDYFRFGAGEAKVRIGELVEEGELVPVAVEGWDRPAYLVSAVTRARAIEARALLAPFDPLIWQRQRTEAVFGARIRLEISPPRHRGSWGYYVLPLLLGEEIVARVDLKADRKRLVLIVKAAHPEPGFVASALVEPLAAELRLMARWLGLESIEVAPHGSLARLLAGMLKAAA